MTITQVKPQTLLTVAEAAERLRVSPWSIWSGARERKLSITADPYSHVMSDGMELDYAAVLGMTNR